MCLRFGAVAIAVLCGRRRYLGARCSLSKEWEQIMESNIEQLEGRYQALLNDYQSGRLDEAAFVAEVDQLQFQDEWGRYWMIGTQSGDWHYYDGQSWHQADPRDADKLPIMDDQGRYWQKGTKSGEWYYYEQNQMSG